MVRIQWGLGTRPKTLLVVVDIASDGSDSIESNAKTSSKAGAGESKELISMIGTLGQ